MESKLQAENQELQERLREAIIAHDNSNMKLIRAEARITDLLDRVSDLIKENHKLADMILDKEEKGQ